MSDLLAVSHSRDRDRALTDPAEAANPPTAARDLAGPPLLAFDKVSKWYGPVLGLNEVSLTLRPGITGLVGPNGAGKSTLIRLATGQLRASIGRVTIRGHDAWGPVAKRFLGYCPDSDSFYEEMSGRRFVYSMARLSGFSAREARDRTEAVLTQVGMQDRADRKLRGYSKGMRQRIKLAQALVHEPELVILDEPLNGVDPVGRHEMNEVFVKLAKAGKSLLISSHQLEELEKLTDEIVIIARGLKIAQGTVIQIRDLMSDLPLMIRVDCDRPRALAAALLRLPDVTGVEIKSDATVVARAKNPLRFFPDLTALVLDESYDVRHLETLDASAQAILDYIIKDF
jgi:ABC-2 type transport system ATP-binding protein